MNNVNVTGDLIRPAEELLGKLEMTKEKPFSRETVRKDVLTLREVYSDEGYAYAEVVPVTKEDDRNHTVDITYQATKSNKVRFERINIAGNTTTRDNVIRRELKVYEGEYFSGQGLRDSIRNLRRLDFFEDVEIQNKKGSADDLMELNLNVKERPTGTFSIGAGYSGYEGVMGTMEVSQKNFLGTGRLLLAQLRLSSISAYYDIRLVGL